MKKLIIHEIESELKVTLESVEKAHPSIYSKEDVRKVLVGFTENITRWVSEAPEEKSKDFAISPERLELLETALLQGICRKVERLDSEEVVDYSSASFSINYNNTVEIDTIDYNSDAVTEVIDIAVSEVLHDFFAPEEEVLETPYATEQ